MTEKTHDNLPLKYDWDRGEYYKPGMDANLRMLGAVVHLSVESRSSDEPGAPTNGSRYIHNGGTWSVGSAGDVIARIADAWYAYTPGDGWIAKCLDESRWIEYETAAGDWVGFADVLHNDSATADPTATDDTAAGYSAGSRWYNTNNGELFRCVDATAGAAVWLKTTLTLDELGSAATQDDTRYAHRANNLSDLASAPDARDNLGLGDAAPGDKAHLQYDPDSGEYINVLSAPFMQVRNNTAATIPAGTLVEITGSSGNLPYIATAEKDTTRTVSGITTESIGVNSNGLIQVTGTLQESFIDTNSMTAGADLYLGDGGAYTDVRPVTGNPIIVGKVGIATNTDGSLLLDMPAKALDEAVSDAILRNRLGI